MNKFYLLLYLLSVYLFTNIYIIQGREIIVSNISELQNAINTIASDDTVLINNGTYNITNTLVINNKPEKISNVLIKGLSGNRDSVKLFCPGMGVESSSAPHVFNIYNVENLIIQDLTAGKTYWHPVTISGQSGAENIYLKNLRLLDAGEQSIKVNNKEDPKCDNGIVDGCLIEYTDYAFWAGDHYYTQGFDKIGGGDNWIVRNCVFKNIRPHPEHVDQADGCGAAITYWQGGTNNIVEKNIIINCRMGIEFGISDNTGVTGGIIRNNIIYRGADEVGGDNGIRINDSPDCKVYNNTVILNATFDPSSDGKGKTLEYRWDGSTNLQIKNNLCDGLIWERTAGLNPDIANNIFYAELSWFKNPANADLHLNETATDAIDKGLTLTDVLDDIDGTTRPIYDGYDIGADEYSTIVPIKNNIFQKSFHHNIYTHFFSSLIKINYYLPRASQVTIIFYNSAGRKIWKVNNQHQSAGNYEVKINTVNWASGLYFYTFTIDNKINPIKKVFYLK